MHGVGTSKKDEPFAGFAPAPTSPNVPADPNVAAAELGKAEAFKQLSSKIIELENKLSIATKREVNLIVFVSCCYTFVPFFFFCLA